MSTLSEQAIIDKINQRELFTATIDGGGFTVKITKYEPALCTAIHSGENMRSELIHNCLLSKQERYFEEDPLTDCFIEQQAISLVGHDSRYEYDLNRSIDECVYETAWSKEVWKEPLSNLAKAKSKKKYAQFYRIVSVLIEALVEEFGQCLVYDTHSYNHRRHQRADLPVFDLDTTYAKDDKWRSTIDDWLAELRDIDIEGVNISAAENFMFYGKGYLIAYCHSSYDNVLVLATDIKKVFMNELTGDVDKEIFAKMHESYNQAVSKNTKNYMKRLAPLN